MSDSIKQTTRQLQIKTGSLKRLAKEVDLYKKEHSEQKVVVEKLSGVNEDEWELKNARKVLKDCEQMIFPSEERVKEAYQDLSALVQATADDEGISSTPEYINASNLLKEIKLPESDVLE